MRLYNLLDIETISPSAITISQKPYFEWLSDFYVVRKINNSGGTEQDILYVYVDKDGNVYTDMNNLVYISQKG